MSRWEPVALTKLHGVDVCVTESGQFVASVAGERLRSDTLAGLSTAIQAMLRRTRVKVAVPAMIPDRVRHVPEYGSPYWRSGRGFQPITLTGVHRVSGRVLYVSEDERGQLQTRGVLRPLSEEEQAEYFRLQDAKRAAEQAYDRFVEAMTIDPKAAVRAAVAATVDTPQEEPDVEALDADPR